MNDREPLFAQNEPMPLAAHHSAQDQVAPLFTGPMSTPRSMMSAHRSHAAGAPAGTVAAPFPPHLPQWSRQQDFAHRRVATGAWDATFSVLARLGAASAETAFHPELTVSQAWVDIRIPAGDDICVLTAALERIEQALSAPESPGRAAARPAARRSRRKNLLAA